MREIRDIGSDELKAARALFEGLGPVDQIHHFQQVMTGADLDDWEARARTHRLIGCFEHGALVGLSEVAFDRDHAECSLCIEAGHRGQGIGTALFERSCTAAREAGARSLTILVTRGDATMLDMAVRHHGLSVFRHSRSMILPAGEHPTAFWLVFELDHESPETWFSHAVRRVCEALAF